MEGGLAALGLYWFCKSRDALGQSRITLNAGLLVVLVYAPNPNVCSNRTAVIQTHTGILLDAVLHRGELLILL